MKVQTTVFQIIVNIYLSLNLEMCSYTTHCWLRIRMYGCLWFLHSRGSWRQLQQMYGHTKKGYSGFKSGDGKVILKRLGPLMGRVSYKQEVLKSCNTLASPVIYLNVSLSWFKTFPILVWLLLMLLQLEPRRNHTSIYTDKFKELFTEA